MENDQAAQELQASRDEVDRWRAQFEKINAECRFLTKQIEQMSLIHGETLRQVCALLVKEYDNAETLERRELQARYGATDEDHIAGWKSHCKSMESLVAKLQKLLTVILVEDYQI